MSGALVSFCVKSYNQRRYLKAALEGALAQTYRPLEIVVSDDGSTDGSWELIQEVIDDYKKSSNSTVDLDPQPRPSIILNRNEKNLGSLGNWEKLCELAHGELIVKADGDDVSLPDRTARIVAAWEKDGKKATAICHSGWQIGRKGESRGKLRQVTALWPLGAAMAFSPKVFQTFGFTNDGSIVDDELYSRRAMMIGRVLEIPDRLVKYRLGSGATTDNWNIRKLVETCAQMSLKAIRQALTDLEALPDEKLGAPREELMCTFSDELSFYEHKLTLITAPRFRDRLRAYRALGPFRPDIAHYQLFAFLMPRILGDTLLLAYALVRNCYQWIS